MGCFIPALAQQFQVISSNPPELVVIQGEEAKADITYDTLDGNQNLSGILVRIHYTGISNLDSGSITVLPVPS